MAKESSEKDAPIGLILPRNWNMPTVLLWWLLMPVTTARVSIRVEVFPSCESEVPPAPMAFRHAAVSVCSLHEAATRIAAAAPGPDRVGQVCLHSGIHELRRPVRLDARHAHSRWTACSQINPTNGASGSGKAIITGGLSIPPESWRIDNQTAPAIWTAPLPCTNVTGPIKHARTLFVDGVRANRTVFNASALLGRLSLTAGGYLAEHPVPWTASAEEVELNYFQQLAPWQAPRCLVKQAVGRDLQVSEPCLSALNARVASIAGLPRNRSSGRTGCADSDPGCGHLEGNPLGSGLPMYVENIPLHDVEGVPGQFYFSPRRQRLWYHPLPEQIRGARMTATAVVPVAEGLLYGAGVHDVSIEGIDLQYAAWNEPSSAVGFVDFQDGVTAQGWMPGALTCNNCSRVSVRDCGFRHMGGSGVVFAGVARYVSLEQLHIKDVSGNGITVGTHPDTSVTALQSTNNRVIDCLVERVGQEFTGCCGVVAGYNIGLNISHNTINDMPYGGISVGAGAARPGYARDNTIAYNRVFGWMLKMQDSAGVYVSGRQPGSRMHRNFLSGQRLSGLEPPPHCDAPEQGRRCTLQEVVDFEDIWIREVGAPYNISKCTRTPSGWCNQTGNMHGGGIYPDNGSGGWEVTENAVKDVYHWVFVWDGRPDKMVDMSFHNNFVNTPLFSNNAAANNVSVYDNVLVRPGQQWPAEAVQVMEAAGARSFGG